MSSAPLLFVPALVLAFAGCSTDSPTPPTERETPAAPQPVQKGSTPQSPNPSTPSKAEVSSQLRSIAGSGNTFAMDLYGQLGSQPGNFAFSPASISTAFAMTYAGARGETAEQMRDTLHFDLPSEELHAAYGEQIAAWNDPSRTAYELRVANRLFGELSASFEQPFLDLTASAYAAPLERLDFIKAVEPSRERINGWVEEQTNERIKDLLPPRSIDPMTRLVLTNAIYFKGKWKTEFDKKATYDSEFYLPSGATVVVPMMHQSADLAYAEVDGVQILEMPYVGDELAMDILLPKSRDGLADLEAKMKGDTVEGWLKQLALAKIDEVDVTLPRFKIDPAEPISLAHALESLGMVLPFSAKADFSAMGRGLHIDDAFHKAFVEVNEEGTEAAAATAVVAAEGAAMGNQFIADHPFVFVIRDLRSGAMLFVGRVVDPGE